MHFAKFLLEWDAEELQDADAGDWGLPGGGADDEGVDDVCLPPRGRAKQPARALPVKPCIPSGIHRIVEYRKKPERDVMNQIRSSADAFFLAVLVCAVTPAQDGPAPQIRFEIEHWLDTGPAVLLEIRPEGGAAIQCSAIPSLPRSSRAFLASVPVKDSLTDRVLALRLMRQGSPNTLLASRKVRLTVSSEGQPSIFTANSYKGTDLDPENGQPVPSGDYVSLLDTSNVGKAKLWMEYPDSEKIPYRILEREVNREHWVSYDLEIDLIGNRLPTESEIAEVSRSLKSRETAHEKVFVMFYLPGMVIDSGAFATANHPDMKVRIMEFMVPDQIKFRMKGSPTRAADHMAQMYLDQASSFLEQGNLEGARRSAEKVISKYPGTDAAERAQMILEEIEKQDN